MADLLSIASSGVNVYQRALATVSNNIANLGTDGYSRQTTEISQNPSINTGRGFIGTGAYFDRVARQYDGFLESALQQATADLEAQNATTEFTSRLLNMLGDEEIGLTGSFNAFFGAAKALSSDPASKALRGSMIREAEGVAARFKGLAAELDALGEQSYSAMQADVESANAIAAQIAKVNRQLLNRDSAANQPPGLMDRRDQLIRDLAEYVQIRTSFDKRGLATIGLTSSVSRGVLVNGVDFSSLSISQPTSSQRDLAYNLQGDLGTETISGVPSGSISGFANFSESTIASVSIGLDDLADRFVKEVNQIQVSGLDANGDIGKQFFEFVPTFDLDRGASSSDIEIDASVVDSNIYANQPINISYDSTIDRWTASSAEMEPVVATKSGEIQLLGVTLRISGEGVAGDSFRLTPNLSEARNITLELQSGAQIATASMFRVIAPASNSGVTRPTVEFLGRPTTGDMFVDSSQMTLNKSFVVSPSSKTPLSIIQAGVQEAELIIDPSLGSSASLQIITSDGRHLVGKEGDRAKREEMTANLEHFTEGAAYSTHYLNQSGADGYKNFDLFYGNQVEAQKVTNVLPFGSISFEPPVGTNFAGGNLDFTLIPAGQGDEIAISKSPFIETELGKVSFFNDALYIGQGRDALRLGAVSSLYNGEAQTLRVNFEDSIDSSVITDAVATDIVGLVTFNNGTDLTLQKNTVYKTVNTELSTSSGDLSFQQSVSFSSLDRVNASRTSDTNSRYIAKINTRPLEYVSGAGRVLIDGDDLSINGVDLDALVIGNSGVLTADDVKSWLDSAEAGVQVVAGNMIEVSESSLRLNSGSSLTINTESIVSVETGSTTRFNDLDDLVASINEKSERTGVFAGRNVAGKLILQNVDLAGANITIGTTAVGSSENVLGIASKSYVGSLSMSYESNNNSALRFELGKDGEPSDLNFLGLDTTIKLNGDIDEDLLVFVDGNDTATVSMGVVNSNIPFADGLRARQLQVNFPAEDRVLITDLTTNTVVAERPYNGELSIEYQGVLVNFEQPARPGDSFIIDGNNLGPDGSFDALGNNQNALRFVALENKEVMDDGASLGEGYLQFVGQVGNLATQAETSREALVIIKTQAIEARERVSGVSLDQEAADLIRFQQAYQASAQIMQVASKIFDAVLQVR